MSEDNYPSYREQQYRSSSRRYGGNGKHHHYGPPSDPEEYYHDQSARHAKPSFQKKRETMREVDFDKKK